MEITQQQYNKISYTAQFASKVVVHKEKLRSILEEIPLNDPKYNDKWHVLNSIIGSAEEFERIVKDELHSKTH